MSKMDVRWHRLAVAAATAAVLVGLAPVVVEGKKAPATREEFTAFAINMAATPGPRTTGGSTTVTIVIDRWSTQEERQVLIQAFAQKGADGLLSALQKTQRVGFIRLPQTRGWDLHYAVQVPTEDGGRRIIIGTDRPVSFAEASRDTRSMDYPFALIELHLDQNGEGEGRLSPATKIALNKDGTQIELVNWSSEPVRLTKLRQRK